jgi:2-polyprenyl-3-methyl-5-hydroxy-6-metoxy-1,4-benzoquinol methylase
MLAQRSGIGLRYAQEWLEQQTVMGLLEVDDACKHWDRRLYYLTEGHREVLLDPRSPLHAAPLAILPIGGIMQVLPRLLDSYRTGGGVPFSDYGGDFHEAQAEFNRTVYLTQLPRWIATYMPDLHRLLTAGCRVADLGCGLGWSSIGLACAYPNIQIDAFDRAADSLTRARQAAHEALVGDRITFRHGDVREIAPRSRYDLVCIFDTLHDLSQPVAVLQLCHELLSRDGGVLLMEPNAAEAFSPDATPTERFLYAISLLHCLPVGLSEQPSAGTGTVLRPQTMQRLAREAGFSSVKTIDVNHRFYRLYFLSNQP